MKLGLTLLALAAGAVDPRLAAEIAQIKAIDHRAHPVRPASPGHFATTFASFNGLK